MVQSVAHVQGIEEADPYALKGSRGAAVSTVQEGLRATLKRNHETLSKRYNLPAEVVDALTEYNPDLTIENKWGEALDEKY